jgi:hypothetical protein
VQVAAVIWSVTWYVLALLPVAAIIYIVRAYRKRNAARAAASRDRFAQIFDAAAGRNAKPGAVLPAPPVAVAGAASPGRGTGTYARRLHVLTAQQIQLRGLLRRALPDHDVLSSVSLAAVIEVCGLPEGREREQRWRALAQQTVDCVVCSNAHAVLAVVDLDSGSTAETRFKSECLKAAGVRYLRCNPLELPRDNEISALILGG